MAERGEMPCLNSSRKMWLLSFPISHLTAMFKMHGRLVVSCDIVNTSFMISVDGSFIYNAGRLSQLSRIFKDAVAYPMLQFAMQGQ